MRTVVEEVRDLGKTMGFSAWQTSGLESGRWILVDCVSVVCHVFDSDSRDFYDLELLWGDCPRIDWRKALGLPQAPPFRREPSARQRFDQAAGTDEQGAQDEEARLEGDDQNESGDADEADDADADAPVMIELPDLSTGPNSVEFVEVDPPDKRRKRGRALYPTPIADEDAIDEEQSMHVLSDRAGAEQSLDQDQQQRNSERAADADVEAVSDEDLPRSKIKNRPISKVSANLSRTTIGESDKKPQRPSPAKPTPAPRPRNVKKTKAHAVKTPAAAKKTKPPAKKPAKKSPQKPTTKKSAKPKPKPKAKPRPKK